MSISWVRILKVSMDAPDHSTCKHVNYKDAPEVPTEVAFAMVGKTEKRVVRLETVVGALKIPLACLSRSASAFSAFLPGAE
jgi:hypothetical protein